MPELTIRDEAEVDDEAVRAVNRAAFARDDEADLVDRLRSAGLVICSRVATEAGRVVGHVLFSPVWIDTERGGVAVASLAPLAVLPGSQRRGIGSALVHSGVEACRADGWAAVVLIGHPDFYCQLGFARAPIAGLRNPYGRAAFLGLELSPGALARLTGTVRYPRAFDAASRA